MPQSDCTCCGCIEAGREEHTCDTLDGRSLAMVYSPCQRWRGIYSSDMALSRGTMFKELDMPFGIERSMTRGGCGCGK